MRTRRRNKNKKSGVVFTLVVVAAVIVIVYMSAAGALGNWIADAIGKSSPSPSPSSTPSSLDKIERTISIASKNMYAIQIGAYDASNNAVTAAADLQKRGGAGYLLSDGSYRIIASVYASQDDAANVRSKLLANNNISSQIYTFKAKEISCKVTATKAQADSIEEMFKFYDKVTLKLEEVSMGFDSDAETVASAKQALGELASECAQTRGEFTSAIAGNSNPVFSKLNAFYTSVENILNGVADSNETDKVKLSAKLKYIYIDIVKLYCDFIDSLSSN